MSLHLTRLISISACADGIASNPIVVNSNPARRVWMIGMVLIRDDLAENHSKWALAML